MESKKEFYERIRVQQEQENKPEEHVQKVRRSILEHKYGCTHAKEEEER